MSQQESMPAQVKDDDITAILTEYKALRDEIVKRIEFRYQIVNLILVVAGIFLTIGVQASSPASVLLVYPILALFLISGWAHNGKTTLQIAKYIRESIENKLKPQLHWETDMQRDFHKYQTFNSWGFRYVAGLVMTTQILAFGLALGKTNFTTTDIILIVFSVLAIVLTVTVLRDITQLER